MKTRECLGIIWEGADEVGINAYALLSDARLKEIEFSLRGWPGDAATKCLPMHGTGWTVFRYLVRLPTLPPADRWRVLVANSLRQLVAEGSLIAWCGMEGAFWDPPYLFEPSKMPCSVWACCSASGIEVEPPGLDDSFGYVGRDVLIKLHREVVDLVSGRATP